MTRVNYDTPSKEFKILAIYHPYPASRSDMDLPNKTLIYVVHLPEPPFALNSQCEYINYYKTHRYTLSVSKHKYDTFRSAVILNDYETFINKVYHTIKAL